MNTVTNLSDYLELTTKNSKEIFYRGECKDYGESACVAKANRSIENYEKYSKRMKLFERKVREATLLNDCDPLIPYAQHNGLATRLLDISSSPIVALYFACQGAEDDGCVYVFEDYAEVTELLTKYPSFDLENVLLKHLDLLIDQKFKFQIDHKDDEKYQYHKIEHEELEEFGRCIEQYRFKYVEGGYKEHIIARFISKDDSLFVKKWKILNEILENIKICMLAFCKQNEDLQNRMLPKNYKADTSNIDFIHPYQEKRYGYYNKQYEEFDFEVKEYLISLESLVAFINDKSPFGNISGLTSFGNWTMNFIPNLLYQPIMTFKRGLSQESSFFLQPLFSKHAIKYIDPKTDEVHSENPQQLLKCQANHIGKIIIDGKSKSKILEELDKIGVNKATMFGDADNIADYIMNLKEI